MHRALYIICVYIIYMHIWPIYICIIIYIYKLT